MATSTRRRKPAPADAATPDLLATATETAAPAEPAQTAASELQAAAEAAAPAKRPRAPRKTTAAPRKRQAPADQAEPKADATEAPPEPAAAPAAEPPRPRRRGSRAAAAASESAAPAEAEVAPAAAEEPPVEPVPSLEAPAEPAAEEPAPEEAVAPSEAEAPAAPAEPPAPPLPENSSLVLEEGLQRRLRWQAGSRCPDTLAQAVRRWQPRGESALALSHLDELTELLAIAARTGHPLEVEEAVWTHLARLGDLQGRIAHLESRHPEGLDPAVQPEGSLLAGWRACQLEAAFFAACVGRCVLADEAALKPEDELLLAARLVMQHFGSHAPVVQAPASAHAAWQAAWESLWSAEAERPPLTLLAANATVPSGTELLLLDQRAGLDPVAAESLAAQAAGWLWVLAPHDVLERPEALPLFTAVDQLRQGGLAQWQAEGDAAALASVLLARRFADVASQWPAWAPAVRATAATIGEASLRDELAARLERWQRSGYLADSDQLALRRTLHSLWEAARAANIAALPALLGEALAGGAGRIVVFTEDAAALPALTAALQAEGMPAQALPHAGPPRLADQALRAFREAEGAQILLVADAPEGAESRIGVQLAAPVVIHLDTPWPADALARRLQRVRPGAAQREVPAWQLLPEGSVMARRAKAAPAVTATRLTGPLLRGPVLEAWQAELASLL